VVVVVAVVVVVDRVVVVVLAVVDVAVVVVLVVVDGCCSHTTSQRNALNLAKGSTRLVKRFVLVAAIANTNLKKICYII